MYIISKTCKGKEYLYSKNYSILCKNEDQAKKLADHLNNNNNNSIDDFKLKENELWYVYKVDRYDDPPKYELKATKNRISIKEFIDDKGLFYSL